MAIKLNLISFAQIYQIQALKQMCYESTLSKPQITGKITSNTVFHSMSLINMVLWIRWLILCRQLSVVTSTKHYIYNNKFLFHDAWRKKNRNRLRRWWKSSWTVRIDGLGMDNSRAVRNKDDIDIETINTTYFLFTFYLFSAKLSFVKLHLAYSLWISFYYLYLSSISLIFYCSKGKILQFISWSFKSLPR